MKGRSAAVLAAGVVAASAVVGIAPGLLTFAGTIALVSMLIAAVLAWQLRRALRVIAVTHRDKRAASPEPSAEPLAGGEPRPPARDLRAARVLFYLGVLTIGEPLWRKGLTLSEAFFLSSFLGCVFSVIRGRVVARLPVLLLIGVGVFALGAGISSVHAVSAAGSFFNDAHGVYVLCIWVWTGCMVLRRKEHVYIVFALWSISLAVDGIAAMAQVFGLHGLAGAPVGHRATAFTPTPNDLGGAASIALVPAIFFATRRSREGNWRAVARWIAAAWVAVGLVLSGSVSGMSGAAAGLIIWLVAPQVRVYARIAIISALALVLIVVLLAGSRTTSPLQRLQLVSGSYSGQTGAGSGLDRLAIVKAIWPRIGRDPFVGTGVDVSGTVVTIISDGGTQSYQVHGAPLAAWYEAGLLGLIGVAVIVISHLSMGWRNVRYADSGEEQLAALALLSAFLAFIVFAMTSPFLFQQYGWLSAVLIVAWSVLRDRDASVGLKHPQRAPSLVGEEGHPPVSSETRRLTVADRIAS